MEELIRRIQAEYLNAQVENRTEDVLRHRYRLKSIRRSLDIIKRLDFNIQDVNQIRGIPGIGKGTLRRVDEILRTGDLAELHDMHNPQRQKTIESILELENVIGIGSRLAHKLVAEHHIRSIPELQQAVQEGRVRLPRPAQLGLRYYGIVQGGIPRKETEAIYRAIKRAAHKIDPQLEVMVCGSYRRGRTVSGDIDILMYHPAYRSTEDSTPNFLIRLTDDLYKTGLLLDHLARDSKKYNGFGRYDQKPIRRIDIRLIPYTSMPAAMLYFTGPVELNTYMRNLAKKKGLLLNEYGLYQRVDGHWRTLPVKSEEDIFRKLGMPYLSPAVRDQYSMGKIR